MSTMCDKNHKFYHVTFLKMFAVVLNEHIVLSPNYGTLKIVFRNGSCCDKITMMTCSLQS